MTEIEKAISDLAAKAARAARILATRDAAQKNAMLLAMADGLEQRQSDILSANSEDLAQGRDSGLSAALLDRLELTPSRFDAMVAGLRDVAALTDPVGQALERMTHENGMELVKQRVPIGVIGIVYESRPNVTADAAGLCLKAGNAVILRGGREAIRSNTAIAEALNLAQQAGMPGGAVTLIPMTDREAVRALVQCETSVDLVIPRGGEGLIRAVVEHARVPVIKHYKGICHVYLDRAADHQKALEIVHNAKCQRPGVCNAMETLLIHTEIADALLPQIAERLADAGVELRGDARARAIVPTLGAASEADWATEYLDLILSIRVVDDLASAIDHIATYGSQHSDAIVSEDPAAQRAFVAGVDAAAVYVNASTRFTDGSVFGMGAEIGISTDKLHARGPMGVNELTSYKYVVTGSGQVR